MELSVVGDGGAVCVAKSRAYELIARGDGKASAKTAALAVMARETLR